MRIVENYNLLDCNELIIRAALARKASSKFLGFNRIDYPQLDPPEWRKFITVKQENGKVKTAERPLDYCGNLKENYEAHNRDYIKEHEG